MKTLIASTFGALSLGVFAGIDLNLGKAVYESYASGNRSGVEYTDSNGAKWKFGTLPANSGAMSSIAAFPTSYAYDGVSALGFCTSQGGGLPYACANYGASACTTEGITLQPNEVMVHPNSTEQASPCIAFGLCVPASGVYAVSFSARDEGFSNGDFPDGVLVKIYKNGSVLRSWEVCKDVNVEKSAVALFVESFAKGDEVVVTVDPNVHYAYDTTVLYLNMSRGGALDGSKVVSVDIDGKQPGDAEPTTYRGMGGVVTGGDYWNSFYAVENTSSSFTLNGLKDANGNASPVVVTIASTDNGVIGFDNLNTESDPTASAALEGDYMYMVNRYATVSISGLVPGKVYDLYLFGRANGSSSATFGDEQKTAGDLGAAPCTGMRFQDLVADENGAISGTLSGGGAAGVYYGFQIVDMSPAKKPLMIIIR